jgi:hypothetical protein
MKKKVFILVSILLATSISVINTSQASASDCNSENPCGTWAVLDSAGTVTNIIVCQASVCGSGEFAGQKVVEQFAPSPVTHDSTGGWVTSEQTTVVYSEGIFTVTQENPNSNLSDENNKPTLFSFSAPEKEHNGSYTSIAANFCSEFKLKEGDCAVVTATNQSINGTIVESDIIDTTTISEPQLRQQFLDNARSLLIEKVQTVLKAINQLIKKLGI